MASIDPGSSSTEGDARDPAKARLPGTVRVLGFTSLANDVATEMMFPLLPTFLLTLAGGTRFDLGIIEGIADATSSLLRLFAGTWSDRVGARKGFVIVGYAVAAVARPLIGLATAPWHVNLARTVDRVGKGIRAAPRDALIADAAGPTGRGRAFGFNRAMDHLGATIGPLLASIFLVLWPGQLRLLFLLTLIPGLVVVVLVLVGLRETSRPVASRSDFLWTWKPLSGPFRVYLLAILLCTLGNPTDAFLLARANELGVPAAALPILWAVFNLAKSGGNWIVGPWVDRIGARPFLFAGWALYFAVYWCFGRAWLSWHAWALFMVYALYYAAAEPAEKALVAQLVRPEHRGLAFGWFHFSIGLGALPASIAFGWLYEHFTARAAFDMGAVFALAALAVLSLVGRQRDR